ncbi:hypothetical protein K8T06_01225, partial [bacterium]|nr:hypothetical protein [bacterium]
WSSPSFTNSNVDSLTNGDFTPFIMDVSCDNGKFDGASDCFAERWIKGDGHGAMGMFSSSTSTSWDEPAVLAWGVTYSVTGDSTGTYPGGEYLLGQMTYNGISYMYDDMGTGSNTVEVMNQYVLFGDCSAMFRSDVSIVPEVSHMPTAPMAPMPFEVTVTDGGVPIEGAFVCAFKPGDVHVVGETDGSGVAILEITPTTIGDMIVTVYGQNLVPQENIVMVAPAGCGVVVLDRTGYNCDDIVIMSVFDSDLNANPGVVEVVDVDIVSDSEPVPEFVTLTETGPDTAEFVGSILTSDSQSGLGYLLVSDGDVITLHYHDLDCDGTSADVYDYAGVDCSGPTITGTSVSGVTIESAIISWNTDEESTTVLYWGTTTPPVNMEVVSGMTTEHVVLLTGLDACTEYFFYVVSIDAHGNEAMDDNGGAYYNFTTLQLMLMLDANMDNDPGWTYEGQWAWGVPLGSDGDPTTGQTGDNVVGYNLSGSYGNGMMAEYATTSGFDCSGASQTYLSFYKWLGVESSSYDHATLEISGDAGSSWDIIWENSATASGGNWEYVEFDVTTWAAGNSDVRLRWSMGPTDGSVVYCGWNIDDVMVSYTAPCNVPILTYESHIIDDSLGNNDGEINGGEAISIPVTLANIGLDAHNVSATISTTNAHITITNASVTFPDIPQSGSAVADDAFGIFVDIEAEDGELIPFTISWTCDENSGSTIFTEMVVAPALVVSGYSIIEVSGGEFDGIWEPGETVRILVDAHNSGFGMAHTVEGILESNMSDDVTIDDAIATWADIAGGASGTCEAPYFTVTASAAIPDPSTVIFTVHFYADGYMTTSDFMMDCTSSNFARRYFWNMDVDPVWVAEGMWEHGVPQGNEGDPASGYTGDNVYGYNLAGDYTNNMTETNLTTDAIDCTGLSDVEVRFMRWLGVESSSYDHASFQVSNDGTSWTTLWTHSGSSFTDPDWTQQVFDISSVADDQATVFLRWVMGSTDNSVTYCGWNIDDVEIWADGGAIEPTPTPTPVECINHGDVDLNGELTAGDAQLAFQIALMMYTPSYEEECAADCNGDSEVTA